ncbi:MAG: hypothetical protein NTY01_18770 [Verrucomicrobia bacterium]|nr:hypothetical protein [Verrucomicrobiota bacterium]
MLDGQYTPRNRPIQDLVTFHEVGRKELKLDWPALLNGLAVTPVEPVQAHVMRVGERRGELGQHVPNGWRPDLAPLLNAVMEKNRSYLKALIPQDINELRLEETPNGLDCSAKLREISGLHYAEMVAMANKAGFRDALRRIGAAIADLFPTGAQIHLRKNP